MLYLIDSNISTSSQQLTRIMRILDKYGAKYTLLSTYKSSGRWADHYSPTLDKEIVKGILKFYDYDLSKVAKLPNSSTVRTMTKKHPQAVREYRSSTFQDKKLSEVIDWFSEHPQFLNAGIMYESRNGVCTANLRNDEFRAFLPRSKKDKTRYAALNVAFGELGISENEVATPRPKKASYGHNKGGYKWEL